MSSAFLPLWWRLLKSEVWCELHSSNCELWRHCWCCRRHPRCLGRRRRLVRGGDGGAKVGGDDGEAVRVNTSHRGCQSRSQSLSLTSSLSSSAMAFSQPFFKPSFEGQHPPRQQGVDDLTPAAATALNAAAACCLEQQASSSRGEATMLQTSMHAGYSVRHLNVQI